MTQGTLKKVVRTYQEVDVSPVSPSSTTQDVSKSTHHKLILIYKQKNTLDGYPSSVFRFIYAAGGT